MRPGSAPRDSRLASALAWGTGAWRTAPCCTMPWVKKGATKCMGCGKKTEPIDTATNSATLEMAGTHWQLTVDDQGNAARSAGAEGFDTDRARDLKLSASVDVSKLATDPMACENPDQASCSDFVPSSVRAVIRNCPMELDEEFLTAPPGERPPLSGDKEEGQECRAFHPSAVKAFKIQTRLNATTIAQEEAKKADQVEAVERSAAVLHELQGGPLTEEVMGACSCRTWTWTSSVRSCWTSWVRTGGDPHRSSSRPRPLRRRRKRNTKPDRRRAPSKPECSSPSRLPSVRGLVRSGSPLRLGSSSRQRHGGTSVWTTSHPSRTPTWRLFRWVGIPFRRPSCQICRT